MPVQADVFLCGWRVQSELPLPELAPWSGAGTPADIFIRLGPVPPLEAVTASTGRLTMDATGLCRIEIPGLVTFSVRDGCEIVVDPQVASDSLDLRNYLFGTGLGLLCHQRGRLPLHGSCLLLGGKAVILSGRSGAGKSTLAAALAQRGHTLLADDVCVLAETPKGWEVWPAFPRVKLHPAALRAVLGPDAGHPPINGQGKHHFRFEPVRAFTLEPVPLGAIYFLQKTKAGEEEALTDVEGLQGLALLQSQTFRRLFGLLLGRGGSLFEATARITATVPLRHLRRNFDLTRMASSLTLLENAHGGRPPGL